LILLNNISIRGYQLKKNGKYQEEKY